MALALVPAILDRVAANVPGATAWPDWSRRPIFPSEILLFEAFVSEGVSDGHAQADFHSRTSRFRRALPCILQLICSSY